MLAKYNRLIIIYEKLDCKVFLNEILAVTNNLLHKNIILNHFLV